MMDPRAEAAGIALMDQIDHFTLRALKAISGGREDSVLMALVVAAYAVARFTAEAHECADVDAIAEALVQNATRNAHEYAKALLAEGRITYPKESREHERSDAERRFFGLE